MKWKEILYGMSPSMLSFILNSVQDTLPHPVNLRRWKLDTQASCALCGWKHAGFAHILCGCKVALDQGRISYRHDSILTVIQDAIIDKVKKVDNTVPLITGREPVVFVGRGQRVRKKKKKVHHGIIDVSKDWIIQTDLRRKQVQFPPHIITTAERPDLVLYSDSKKVLVILELTSPAEDNIEKWREVKKTKYEKLAENIREGGVWKVFVFTIEVGARGFVAKRTAAVWRQLGMSETDGRKLTETISRTAIRCSHFIWICRNTLEWTAPSHGVTNTSG